MRNLKRALSLTLASIMLLGMMVVGSSAASYQDVTDEHNVEAIEVLQAVGIMVGDEGNFNPEKNVTRNEMAVIMSNLMDYRVATYAGTSPFTDVPSWAEPYVAACYTNGITSGTSATTYNGSGNVTTAQAALMIMKALGYFQTAADFKDDWQLEATRQANSIDLLVGVKAGVREAMTRNDVAQLVLNGLESGIVEADDSNKVSVSVGDAKVDINGNKYVFVTSGEDYAYAIRDRRITTSNDGQFSQGSIVELGEKLYQGSLTKKDATGDNASDAFGRPANIWEYQGASVGTYTETAKSFFSKKVTSKTLYNTVGSAACNMKNYDWEVYVDGKPVPYDGDDLSANKTDNNNCFLTEGDGAPYKDAQTGNGVLTQVYVDPTRVSGDKAKVVVSVIHYYAAEVLRVNNANDADRSITLSDLDAGPATNKDTFETADFAEDDIVVYSYTDGIEEVYAAEKLEGKVTQARANTNDSQGDHFTVDETKYNYNWTVSKGEPRRLTTENVNNNMVGYLDQFGYVVYIDETAVTYDYAYVLSMGTRLDDYDNTLSRASNGTVYARLVLTDGTIVKVQTDEKNTSKLHHIVSYSVDSKDVYSLKDQSKAAIVWGKVVDIDSGVAGMDLMGDAKGFTANANTVFIVATPDDDLDDYNFRVYTGIKNVPDISNLKTAAGTGAVVATGADGIAKVVYIEDAEVSGTKNVIFIKANAGAKLDKVTGSNRNYVISAVENGEVVELLVKEGSQADFKLVSNIDDYTKYPAFNSDGTQWIVAAEYLTRDADGIVTNVKLYDQKLGDPSNSEPKNGYLWSEAGTKKAQSGTVGIGATDRYGYSDDTIIVRYDVKSGDFFVESKMSQIKDDSDDKVLGIFEKRTLTGICYLNTTSGSGEEPVGPKPVDPTTQAKVTVVLDDNATLVGETERVVTKGESLTLTIGAKPGYSVKSVTGGAIVDNGNGTYTLSNIQADVTVKVTTEKVVGKYTLTLAGALLVDPARVGQTNNKVSVYAGSDGVTSSNVVLKMLNGVETAVATYEVAEDAEVVISKGAFTGSGMTLVVDGVNVTLNNNSSDDTISFTMPGKNLTLNMKDADKFVKEDGSNNDTAVYTIKSIGGVTGTFTLTSDSSTQKLEADKEITITGAGTFKVDETGTGSKVITAKSATTGEKGSGEDIAIVGNANVTLYSANKVSVVGTSGKTLAKNTADSITVTEGTDAYVAVGTELTIDANTSGGGADFDGYIVTADSTVKHGAKDSDGKFKVESDVTVYGAWKLTLNGVTAKYASGAQEVTTGQYVAGAVDNLVLTVTDAEKADNQVVVDTTVANTICGVAVTGNRQLSANTAYSAFTKVVLNVEENATLECETYVGMFDTARNQGATAGGDTYGIKSGTTIRVTEKTANGGKTPAVKVTSPASDAVTRATTTSATGVKGVAVITIMDKATEIVAQ